jgi:prepilin-type N-terminal cleavage/methylation domain-containing protein
MSRRRSKVSNQKGFTLIEIIAVLVILGILAAVAIPRFMDLTSVASEKAAMQGVSEGKSRMSNQFARNLLTGSSAQNTTASLAATGNNSLWDAGDYKLSYAAATTGRIRITASGLGNIKGTTTGSWVRPQ